MKLWELEEEDKRLTKKEEFLITAKSEEVKKEKFKQALYENSREEGQYFYHLREKLKKDHFCYIRPEKGEKLPQDRIKDRSEEENEENVCHAMLFVKRNLEQLKKELKLEEQTNNLMVIVKTFWAIYHDDSLLEIVNVERAHKEGKNKKTMLSIKLKELMPLDFSAKEAKKGITVSMVFDNLELKSFDHCLELFNYERSENQELFDFYRETTDKQKQRAEFIQEKKKIVSQTKESINNYEKNFQSLIPDAPEPKIPEITS
ncbi:17278_t:CDS:2 [Racocetra persica]|uniref:17278_t:CDS:1 n=1 Tax=Racocetra persica TaxID=160502 RepID=A0ACA9R7L5_9GLOM|nr:17278_t:CDS:2 [Racocetra persica]